MSTTFLIVMYTVAVFKIYSHLFRTNQCFHVECIDSFSSFSFSTPNGRICQKPDCNLLTSFPPHIYASRYFSAFANQVAIGIKALPVLRDGDEYLCVFGSNLSVSVGLTAPNEIKCQTPKLDRLSGTETRTGPVLFWQLFVRQCIC